MCSFERGQNFDAARSPSQHFKVQVNGKTAQTARRRRFFWKIVHFQAIFKHFWCFLGGLQAPPGRGQGGYNPL